MWGEGRDSDTTKIFHPTPLVLDNDRSLKSMWVWTFVSFFCRTINAVSWRLLELRKSMKVMYFLLLNSRRKGYCIWELWSCMEISSQTLYDSGAKVYLRLGAGWRKNLWESKKATAVLWRSEGKRFWSFTDFDGKRCKRHLSDHVWKVLWFVASRFPGTLGYKQ